MVSHRKSFNSFLGQTLLFDVSGNSLSQAHFFCNSGDKEPFSICTTYLPMMGKNFQPWNDPQVATYSPLEAECGETMKSALGVSASLFLSLA